MKIASYNINGIKARLPAVTDWLEEAAPDVVIFQEIKSIDENFPREHFEDMGYNVETHGQKSFNGVAILSKLPLEDVTRGLANATGTGRDGADDEEARYIEATVVGDHSAVRICGLYLPNGNPVGDEKFAYKLRWMERLEARAKELLALEQPFLMAGDYNVIPQAEDAARPEDWRDDALFQPESRGAFWRLQNLGLTEAFRARSQAPEQYTYWDFQRGAWQRNDGIRIDHFLLSPQCADLLEDCQIDKDVRAREKPSDHVPIWVSLAA
ncbi:exodeoxyribonuclease III [Maritimibacter sp. UBA3975]|uniref:exodeoxyribonuclease III n=1 Tax=Maritimibacter sp. UBA3975 TaxID=1946833 RepID=UPI0025BFF6AA|nr:exodeoxyribonuclease III [Maritimibacter sp. UBA3975]|tara:strand:- start:10207 stop:11010 length:804 start_codon:yes stop_codon:yes gene_type:complete